MRDQVFFPSERLKPFVQCYWTCRHPDDVLEVMYPSGSIELCIDISDGGTIRHRGNQTMQVPKLELLGHWTIATKAVIAKGNTCLIARFHPHAASLFFPNPASDFTNESVDLCDIFKKQTDNFYARLMEYSTLQEKITVLEEFLTKRLAMNKKSHQQLKLVECLCNHLYDRHNLFDIRNLSARFGFSERYIQKLFNNWVGITPQKYFAVRRFNKSLELVRSSEESLTAIAFQCGYYDQAHFIKEFKSYTGLTPGEVKML